MKEQILKILKKNYYPLGELDDDEQCAEEITSHVFEFIEWLHENTDDTRDYECSDRWWVNTLGEWLPINEVYDYYFKTIDHYAKGISMIPVTSSQIKSVGYASNTLYIEFTKGGVYTYNNVPQQTFDALRSAESVGKYFASNIKGKYEYSKIDKLVTNGKLK